VYYLLFDCYPGSAFLENYMQFSNHTIDSSLQSKGFHIIPFSESNYNRTCFSIASTLNFQYLKGIHNHTPVTSRQYNQAILSIQHSAVPNVFRQAGYDMVNLSIFDLPGQASIQRETFLTLPQKTMLLFNTLPVRLSKDIGWNFTMGRYAFRRSTPAGKGDLPDEMVSMKLQKRDFNRIVVDSLARLSGQSTPRPRLATSSASARS